MRPASTRSDTSRRTGSASNDLLTPVASRAAVLNTGAGAVATGAEGTGGTRATRGVVQRP